MSDPSDPSLEKLIRRTRRRNPWQVVTCVVLWGCGGSGDPAQPPLGPELEDIVVRIQTLGDDQDLDGYTLVVDERPGMSIGPNEQLTVRDLPKGLHTFELAEIAANCRQTTVERLLQTYTLVVFCLPPESGTIYYIEIVSAYPNVMVSSVNAIGGDHRSIGPSRVWDLAVSREGDRIALMHTAVRRGPVRIHTMRTDGSNLVQVTGLPGQDNDLYEEATRYDEHPVFSPDGLRIAYTAGSPSSPNTIFVINSDGTGLTQISPTGRGHGKPDWSPDGTRIAFSHAGGSGPPGKSIYLVNPDGSDLERLTDGSGGRDGEPVWSPDGSRIAFVRELAPDEPRSSGQDRTIFVMNADGTDIKQLTSFAPECGASPPNWSPDGRWMVFHVSCETSISCCGGDIRNDIYVMREDGTDVVRLLEDGLYPDWAP